MAKQRGNNEGTITERKDGRWEARITTGYKNGKQQRKCIYGKTRDEVSRKCTEMLAKVNQGQELPNEKLTLKAYLEQWLDTTAKASLAPRTHTRYSELMKIHIIPVLGRYPLARLTPYQVQAHLFTLAKTRSGRTVHHVRAVLRTALNQALRHGLVFRNAAALTEPPKVKQFTPVFLTNEQAKSLIDAVTGSNLEAIVILALTTGMRMGEILGLTWSDIDFNEEKLHVKRQQQIINRVPTLTETKTQKSRRVVDLPNITVQALQRHRLRQILEDMPAAGDKWEQSERVFSDPSGKALNNWVPVLQFHKLCTDNELPQMRLHDLRHSCATILLAKGVHPRIVMEILGHTTIAMTMNVYSHALPSVMKEAAQTMNQALS